MYNQDVFWVDLQFFTHRARQDVLVLFLYGFVLVGPEFEGIEVVFFTESGGGSDILASYKLRKELLVGFDVTLGGIISSERCSICHFHISSNDYNAFKCSRLIGGQKSIMLEHIGFLGSALCLPAFIALPS